MSITSRINRLAGLLGPAEAVAKKVIILSTGGPPIVWADDWLFLHVSPDAWENPHGALSEEQASLMNVGDIIIILCLPPKARDPS